MRAGKKGARWPPAFQRLPKRMGYINPSSSFLCVKQERGIRVFYANWTCGELGVVKELVDPCGRSGESESEGARSNGGA